MGHIIGKDIYKNLGEKIDNLTVRVPWNESLYLILKELYSMEEADVVVKMPYGLADLDKIAKVTEYEKTKLQKILDSLCSKGLVVDIWRGDKYIYMISPMVVGIFEFTLMRTGEDIDIKKWAGLLNDYIKKDDSFFVANFGDDQKISIGRTLPHEEVISSSGYVEVMNYEKATSIIEAANKYSIGLCACRRKASTLGEKECDVPVDTCASFDNAADYLIRHDMAKEVSKTEMLENLAISKKSGLVLHADNVQRRVSFICSCCGCCCAVLLGIKKYGCPNVVFTSTFIANVDEDT